MPFLDDTYVVNERNFFQMNDSHQVQGGQWHDVVIHAPSHVESKATHVMSYNIRGLEPASIYEVIIQAKNKYGWNEVSDLYQFRTHNMNEIGEYIESVEYHTSVAKSGSSPERDYSRTN